MIKVYVYLKDKFDGIASILPFTIQKWGEHKFDIDQKRVFSTIFSYSTLKSILICVSYHNITEHVSLWEACNDIVQSLDKV